MRRRTFLTAVGAGSLAGLNFGHPVLRAGWPLRAIERDQIPADDYQPPDWLHYAQAVYFDGYSPPVYPHLDKFDAGRLLETVTRLGGNLLRFQPIGYYAYYSSKVFRVHPELGSRDLIDEVSRECRKVGVHVYCYTSYGFGFSTREWIEQHSQYKDWAAVDPEGNLYGAFGHIGWMEVQKLCITGDAYRNAIRTVVKELCAHDIDGVYFDCPSAYRSLCFCDSCRKNFREFSGMDLERLSGFVRYGGGVPLDWTNLRNDVDMGAMVAWDAWANARAKEDLLEFRKIVHGSGKFMLCHNGATWEGTSLPLQYRVPQGFMVEASKETYDRLAIGMMGASMARPNRQVAQMYLGSYANEWFGEPRHEDPWVVHNTDLEDEDEIRMEGWANLASGGAPIYATANRLYYGIGSGSAEPAKEIFELMRRVESIHKGSVPVAYVSIVPTWESLQRWRQRASTWNMMMSESLALAMLDARISFDVNPSTEMSDEWLNQQRVVALCGASAISDEDAQKLGQWVAQGGGLLATYDTGLYDSEGRLRQDGGALRKVLGVAMRGEPLESQPECYYRARREHEALGALRAGALVQGDGRVIPVQAEAGAEVVIDCWNLGTEETRGPAVVVHHYGKGRTIYVSGSLEAYYPTSRVRAVRELLGSIIQYLAGGAPLPFQLQAPHGVYGVLRRAPNGDLALWILADVGFKDSASGRMRQEFVRVRNVEVGLRVPEGRSVRGIELVRAQQRLDYQLKNGYAVATVPELHIAEIVHLKLR